MPQPLRLEPLTAEERQTVTANLGLVNWTMQRMVIRPDEWDDRFQDGVLGLMRAVQLYDPTRGTIGNYAPHWIREAIENGRGIEMGHGYRASKWYGTIDEPERPLSLDYPVDANGYGEVPFGELLEAPSMCDESTAPARMVELGLTDDDVTLYTMTIEGAAEMLDVAYCTVTRRRGRLRKRLNAA